MPRHLFSYGVRTAPVCNRMPRHLFSYGVRTAPVCSRMPRHLFSYGVRTAPVCNRMLRHLFSYGVRTAPVCSHMPRHLCAHSKSQTLAATPLLGHMEILHTPIGMGSAALVAAVPYPGKVTGISCKGQRST